MYFKFAKNNCCNYSSSGPFGKSHYCWLIGNICYLHPDINMGCFYFVNAVLPLDKVLESKWLAANPPLFEQTKFSLDEDTMAPKVKPKITGYRVCGCGKEFMPNSNRQSKCPTCQKRNRREKLFKAKKKHRAKTV